MTSSAILKTDVSLGGEKNRMSNASIETKYSIFVPVDISSSVNKSETEGDGEWYVQGYATTPDLDLQGDIILPQGINMDYFLTKGWINYEHKQDAQYIIGVPTDNCHVDLNKGLFVEARLMKDNEYARSMWALANTIQKSGINRQLGFSIEGSVISRNSRDRRIIEGVAIKNVALTTHPANPQATWETLVKSWTTGYGTTPETQQDAGALRREHFADDITNLTYAVKNVAKMYGMSDKEKDFVLREVAKSLDEENPTEDYGAIMLQLARGVSLQQAKDFIERRKETQ